MTREVVTAFGVFALVAALGFDGGGYGATSWGWSAFVLFAVLAVVLAGGIRAPRGAAVLLVAALAALTAWIAASILWSSDVSSSVLEVQRALLYVAAACVFVLADSGLALLVGVFGATVVLCGYGLARWLVGDPEVPLSADPQAGERLSEPIGYANGVAILAVLGLLLAVGFSARASRRAAAAAAAPVPLLATTLYFTFGRGAWLALAAGLAIAVAVGPRRLQLTTTALALAIPAALAVFAGQRLGASASVAVLVSLLCMLAAGVPVLLRAAENLYTPSRRTRAAFAASLAAVPVVIGAAALVKLGGPTGAYDAFKAAPTPTHGNASQRVLSLSGSNRADYWSVAWESYEHHPVLGRGAGTYARTWMRERPVPQPVTDAHSLYLETLAELGPLGVVVLLVALATPFAGRRWAWAGAALGPYAAFLAHAVQDWDWELPAVTIAALACGAAPLAGRAGRRLPRAGVAPAVVLCALTFLAFLGNQALAEASNASDRLDYRAAAAAARRARTLQPWSPEPWRLLGEVELADGSLAAARRYFRGGLDEDPDDWELWLDLGLASDGAVRRAAFTRATALNPLSPELRELGFNRR